MRIDQGPVINTRRKFWAALLLLFLSLALTSTFKTESSSPPNWECLEREVFSRTPMDIYEEILANRGKGTNIYVMDSGEIPEALGNMLVAEWFDDDLERCQPQVFNIHGTLVLSCLLSKEYGLANQAHVHYYHINSPIEYFHGLEKLCADVKGPAVVSLSSGIYAETRSFRLLLPYFSWLAERMIDPVLLVKGCPEGAHI